MASTPDNGADRSLGEQGHPLRALAASPALFILLLGGLALRLTIAYVLFPSSGFESDVASYASWALTLAEHGPAGFYANAGFIDYPPAYMLILWPVGLAARVFGGADVGGAASELVKLPPILLDLAVGYLLYRLALGWSWPGRRAESIALVAATLYVFNPITFYDSALWGQTDAVGALVLLLGVAALIRGNSEGAAALAVVAAMVKPQFGVVLLPLVAVVLARRHLLRPGSGPRGRPWAPASVRGWLERERGPVRLVTSALAGLVVFYLLAQPFGMGICCGGQDYVTVMTQAAGGYPYMSVNAYNPWALAGSGWIDDTGPFLGPLPAVTVGALLLLAGFLWTLVRAAARDDRWTILVAAAVLCMAFFILPTRVHERYIFPAFAVLPLLAAVERRWTVALLALAAGAFINLHGILTVPLYGSANVEALPLGEAFRTQPLIVLSVVLQTAVTVWAALRLRPSLATSPDAFEAAALEGRRWAEGRPWAAAGERAWASAPGSPSGGPLIAGGALPGALPLDAPGEPGPLAAGPHGAVPPGWVPGGEPTWVRGPSALDWIVSRLTLPPIRPDRSQELAGEPGGRLDRLDLLAVGLLVVASLTLRGFRVDEPFDMHFDEVYHARTATEFLQHWRYGEEHSIYEYTHPHLAKYLMAAGIVLAGGNAVTDRSELGVLVSSVAIEPRWSPLSARTERDGDRIWVGTGTGELRAYDLARRVPEASLPTAADALAVDTAAHRLYVADASGDISVLDTTPLDVARLTGSPGDLAAEDFAPAPVGPVLAMEARGGDLVVVGEDGRIASFDTAEGTLQGVAFVAGASGAAFLPSTERVVADPALIDDVRTTATLLAEILDDERKRIEALIEDAAGPVAVAAYVPKAALDDLQARLDEGLLPGIARESGPLLAVGGEEGLVILDATSLARLDQLGLEPSDPDVEGGPVGGLVLTDGDDDPTLYVATGSELVIVPIRDTGPSRSSALRMPGPVSQPLWNEPADLVHVTGETVDGAPTVYVVEPHANAVYADARLPIDPVAVVMDTQPDRPSVDRTQLLAFSADGAVAAVDVGRNAFGWRLPGVLMGGLTVACLYLLARLLFRRRGVAVLAGLLALAEGMLFVNARIAMNDVYVTGFTLAAVTLFAPLYLGVIRRPPRVAAALVGVGLLLGLALAAKWVALYAVGGLVLLVLLRSALGRLVALAGLVGLTAVLGALAVRPAAGVEEPSRNLLFLLLMVLLCGIVAGAIVRRPLRFTRDELRFVMGVSAVVGSLALAGLALGGASLPAEGLVTSQRLLVAGVTALLVAPLLWVVARLAARGGRGPLAPPPVPTPEGAGERAPAAPAGWLRPGWWAGLPWLFALGCLCLLPVAVYVASYAPWVALGNQWGIPLVDDLSAMLGLPSTGGETLLSLTSRMYEYHNDLRATHAASSPWWAWPLDLKPVWFYQDSFADSTTGLIHDSGNPVIFWLAIPGMGFAAWAGWRRHSLSLLVVVVMFATLWLPWARIDRATFQYHVYASLPFALLGLAYFLADLWHGPSRGTWFLARLSAAAAVLAPALLWMTRGPLCALAGTSGVNASGQACGSITRTVSVSDASLVSILVLAAGGAVLLWLIWLSARHAGGERSRAGLLLALLLTAAMTAGGVLGASVAFPTEGSISIAYTADQLWLALLLPLGLLAWLVLRARDARRFVIGAVGAAWIWLVLWYPNLTGLPLPGVLAHTFQLLLPTWMYDFQFNVNRDPPLSGGMVDVATLVVGLVALVFVVAVALVARQWDGRRGRADGLSGPGVPT